MLLAHYRLIDALAKNPAIERSIVQDRSPRFFPTTLWKHNFSKKVQLLESRYFYIDDNSQ